MCLNLAHNFKNFNFFSIPRSLRSVSLYSVSSIAFTCPPKNFGGNADPPLLGPFLVGYSRIVCFNFLLASLVLLVLIKPFKYLVSCFPGLFCFIIYISFICVVDLFLWLGIRFGLDGRIVDGLIMLIWVCLFGPGDSILNGPVLFVSFDLFGLVGSILLVRFWVAGSVCLVFLAWFSSFSFQIWFSWFSLQVWFSSLVSLVRFTRLLLSVWFTSLISVV